MTLVLDTRPAARRTAFTLIVDDGTDGGKEEKFTLQPMTADAYFYLAEKRRELSGMENDMTAKTLENAQSLVDEVVCKLIEPNAPFREWWDEAEFFQRRKVMDALTPIAIPRD